MFKGVNKVIRTYILWDFIINSAWGLLGPVFAIFLIQNITGGNITEGAKLVGIATLFYWVTKSILQIPIGHYLDKNHGERDDFWFYFIGALITGLVPFGFLIATLPWHIYLLQVVHAAAMSMVIPSSYAIFIRHVDKSREAYESGLDSTLLGLGMGITGAIGGILAASIGFNLIFVITGIFTITSAFLLFLIKDDMAQKSPHDIHEIPPPRQF